jgi:hypothetical protein
MHPGFVSSRKILGEGVVVIGFGEVEARVYAQ